MEINLTKIKQFGNIEFLAKQMVEGFITGLHKSPYHGFSVEFAEHRLYNTGESTRHIDWKVYAKTDRLYIKKYEEETNLRCHILIDVSSSMYYPENNLGKITFSIMAASYLVYLLQKQRDAVGITTFSENIELQTPVKSTPLHLHNLMVSLEKLLNDTSKNKKTAASTTLHLIAEKIEKRSLIIIFSDMMENIGQQDELLSALQHLKHNLHEVILFHVTDKKTEEDFEFEERPYEFIDIETGEKLKIRPNEVKDYYIKSIRKVYSELKLKCDQYKIDFIEADINKGFEQILLPYLIKRTKMR